MRSGGTESPGVKEGGGPANGVPGACCRGATPTCCRCRDPGPWFGAIWRVGPVGPAVPRCKVLFIPGCFRDISVPARKHLCKHCRRQAAHLTEDVPYYLNQMGICPSRHSGISRTTFGSFQALRKRTQSGMQRYTSQSTHRQFRRQFTVFSSTRLGCDEHARAGGTRCCRNHTLPLVESALPARC